MLRLPQRRGLVALFLGLGLGSLALLSYLAVSLSTDAVDRRVKESLRASATISAVSINRELAGLAEVTEAFAARRLLKRALSGGPRQYDRREIRRALRQLFGVRPGLGTAFIADAEGVLIDIVPPTPSIVGKDFSFRDWYRGVRATGRPYVSEAYVSQAAGRPEVIAVATPIDSESGRRHLGIVVAAYRIDTIQSFAEQFARAQGLSLVVTDQRGVVLADPRSRRQLVSLRDDPRIAAALAGRTGVTEDNSAVSAYAPVPELGWAVAAEVPSSRAFAEVNRLRWTVAVIGAILALVLCAGAWLLNRMLRQREKAEQEARREASMTRAVLDATRDGIRLFDLEGNMLVANVAVERVASEVFKQPTEGTIYERALAIGDDMTDPDGYRAALETMAADPEYEAVDEFEHASSGRSFQRYTAPVRDASSTLIGRISVLREVTAEREAERLKSELVATVSHELRTPLASILGFAELLAEREYDPETRTRYLRTIHAEAKRLTGLINDFLDLQRIEEGRFTLNLEPFDLASLVREAADVYSAHSSAHTIDVDVPPGPDVVLGERDRIAQVLGNLLSNAIKYSPQGGPVTVRAEPRQEAVRISVADRGLGIPAAEQRRVFSKFFRVDTSDTREIGGTGLGLALCREIVHAHGGRIGFDSVEGEGSTFWFELPAAQAVSAEPTRGAPIVLVVEDDPAAATLLCDYLDSDGFACRVTRSGEEGLELARADPPAAICLDIRLAGELDGWEVLARLKDDPATAHVPVIVCTGGNDRDRAATLGAADFLTKPFSAARLRETIARVLTAERGSVLVVDDDDSVRSLVRATLSGNGLELREAADGEEALEALAAHRPDAIILDLIMPKLDGFAVLERLQADPVTRSIPVVVLTARRLSPEERHRLRTQAVSLLEKSAYSADELRRLVRVALGDG